MLEVQLAEMKTDAGRRLVERLLVRQRKKSHWDIRGNARSNELAEVVRSKSVDPFQFETDSFRNAAERVNSQMAERDIFEHRQGKVLENYMNYDSVDRSDLVRVAIRWVFACAASHPRCDEFRLSYFGQVDLLYLRTNDAVQRLSPTQREDVYAAYLAQYDRLAADPAFRGASGEALAHLRALNEKEPLRITCEILKDVFTTCPHALWIDCRNLVPSCVNFCFVMQGARIGAFSPDEMVSFLKELCGHGICVNTYVWNLIDRGVLIVQNGEIVNPLRA